MSVEQQRWRVEKREGRLIGEYWTAFQGGKAWFDPTTMFFPTWAEAMRYAEEQARTITVTLPRVTSRHKVTCSTHPAQFSFDADPTSEWGGLVRIGSAYGDISFYSWDDVEAVALALLAHARGRA